MEVDGGFIGGSSEDEAELEYSALGYELLLPDHVLALDREELKRLTADVTTIFDKVYRRDPTLSTERTGQLIDDVVQGRVQLFALRDRDSTVVATTAFTKVEPTFPDSKIVSYEAGRTAKMPGTPVRFAARLLQARFVWAERNLGDADYLLAHARVARVQAGRPHHGGVLARLVEHNFIPTHAVYSNYVAQTAAEPFVWVHAPTDPASWRAHVQQQKIHLVDGAASRMLGAMLAESVETTIVYCEPAGNDLHAQAVEVQELIEPSTTSESRYIITNHPVRSRRTLREIPSTTRSNGAIASTGLSDKVILEQDVINHAEVAYTLSTLHRQGFRLAGWAPSNQRYGRLALVLTRPGAVPAGSISVAAPDLSALAQFTATHSFLTDVLSHRPSPEPSVDEVTL